MTISVSCPHCGKTYNVKDDHAGKKFRCKACQSTVEIPDDNADPWDQGLEDLEDYEDEYGGYEEEVYRPRRSSKKKKSQKKRSSAGMPVNVIVALVAMCLLLCLQVLGIVGNLMDINNVRPGTIIGQFGGAIIAIGIIVGVFQRSKVARWTGVVIYGLGTLCSFGCGTISMVMISDPRFKQGFEKGLANGNLNLTLFLFLIAALFAAYVTIVVCLLLPASNDYFTE